MCRTGWRSRWNWPPPARAPRYRRARAALSLEQRPGVAHTARVFREAAPARERLAAREDRGPLLRIQQLSDRSRKALVQQPLDGRARGARNGLACKIPDHGAQLGLCVERETVVDRIDQLVGAEQAVPALPVRVVRDEIEQADPHEPLTMLGPLQQGEVVLLEVGMDEELE